MVEAYFRQGVLDHRHLDARAVDDIGDAGATLGERRFLGKVDLRGEPTKKFRDAVAGVLGVAPPTAPNTAAGDDARTVLWLGPNEWLIVTPPGAEDETADALRAALAGHHVAVTDVSEGRTVIALAGRHARDVLAKGCPIDFHPRVFEPGHCAQSTYGKANVLVQQTSDAPAYDIYVERSFADYLWACLEDAAEEYGLAITMG